MSCKCTRDVMTMTDAYISDPEPHQSILAHLRRYSNHDAGLCLPCFRNSGLYGEIVRNRYFKVTYRKLKNHLRNIISPKSF